MALEKANLIVFGYTKQLQCSSNIPDEIKIIIISYIDNYFQYQTKYKWIIAGQSLQDILSPDTHNKFSLSINSLTFKTASITWHLTAYPTKTHIAFQLKCINKPSEYSQIIGQWRIFCVELQTSNTSIGNYSNYTDLFSQGLSIKDIKRNFLRQITIIFEMQILRIYREITWWNTNENKVIYKHQMCYKQAIQAQKIQFEWLIDGNVMKQMRLAHPGKKFESDIFNKMWCIRIAPNGMDRDYEGEFEIVLQLCSLPRNVEKMCIKWSVECGELGDEAIGARSFTVNDCVAYLTKTIYFSFDQFREMKKDTIKICVGVEVIQMFDADGPAFDDYDDIK